MAHLLLEQTRLTALFFRLKSKDLAELINLTMWRPFPYDKYFTVL